MTGEIIQLTFSKIKGFVWEFFGYVCLVCHWNTEIWDRYDLQIFVDCKVLKLIKKIDSVYINPIKSKLSDYRQVQGGGGNFAP